MNGSDGDTVTTRESERPCGLTALIPIGMSCRGRAEAFARRLQSRLRTLGTQDNGETQPCIDNSQIRSIDNTTAWLPTSSHTDMETHVTSLQPLRQLSAEADSFFDFDIEPESPGSPADECDYSRLLSDQTAATIATAQSRQEQKAIAPESGYVCASPISPDGSVESSHSSSDDPYFDPEISDADKSICGEFFDCIDAKRGELLEKVVLAVPLKLRVNGLPRTDSDSFSDSLPPSQTPDDTSTCAGFSLESNSTLQDIADVEFMQYTDVSITVTAIESETTVTNGYKNGRNDYSNGVHGATLLDTDDHQQPDEEVELNRPQRVRRCSSLKSGKTPPGTPGTPGRKKIVRFADVMGLDLADVRTFLDEMPKVPKSAFDDLEVSSDQLDSSTMSLGHRPEKVLVVLFQQPGALANFMDIVHKQQVCLENAAVTDPINLTITGYVRVRNLDFHKSVYIRYSSDAWLSFADLQAHYVENSCDGFSDKFSFIVFGNALQVGQRIELAIRYHTHGEQFWDNNFGMNYCFQCMPCSGQQQQCPDSLATAMTEMSFNQEDAWYSNCSFY